MSPPTPPATAALRGPDQARPGGLRRREALALAEDLNIHNFVIASDSKQMVANISCGDKGRSGSIIQEINIRAFMFQCNFCFEGRAANVDAHKLAKYSLSLGPGRHLWLGQPHDPSCIPPIVVFE